MKTTTEFGGGVWPVSSTCKEHHDIVVLLFALCTLYLLLFWNCVFAIHSLCYCSINLHCYSRSVQYSCYCFRIVY